MPVRPPAGLRLRPSVSVLMPCRNAEPWLDACLDSLCSQTLTDFEVIAVDDGSTDRTAEIIRDRAEIEPRIRFLTGSAEGGESGLVASLVRAAGIARAPLLARMDADDICLPTRLAAQVEFLSRHPAIAACGCAVRLFPRSALGSGYRRYEAWLNDRVTPRSLLADLFVECPIAHPSLMIRSSVLAGLGGYRDTGWPEDYDLLLRLHAAGMSAANLPDVLLEWRVRPERHSLRSERYAPTAFRRCKVHFLKESFLPAGRPLVVWGAGKVGKPLVRELARQGLQVEAFVDLDPRKIGQSIHGAPVLSPAEFAGFRRQPGAGPYVLVAVGSPGARGEIRRALDDLGLSEILDYRVCA
ncbi:MAG: glycosyltransferase [marine benthic group bacterium]|nr:glycosyltransferase [Gemmatimonadota bacterium]